ncbi:hypothetical protein CIG75_01465 [Tumebacillus algifaecis]|uniref:DUF3298 domain-containing protein n=1 Tax=Tumebacillus algifaecis TaxID=1214604 RepID=A0A223CWQ4_9BACL|nr:hypothetical protein [Tumebacillus algifaecis]ASS73769.1 hypothetical protein CIG75_01465 [Tumebacillus algifaecis]
MNNKLLAVITLSAVLGAGMLYTQVGASEEKEALVVENKQTQIPELFIPGPGQGVADKIEFQVTAENVRLPSEETIYKFKKQNYTKNEVHNMATKLGMKGEVFNLEESLGVNDGDKTLEIEKDSGKILYLNRAHLGQWLVDGKAKQIPTDEQSTQHAIDFLQKMNWLPENFQVRGVTENREIPGNLNPETDQGIVLSKTVHLYKHVNGKPVLGVSRITVEIGHQGEIETVRKYHKEEEAFQKYKLKSLDQAVLELKDKKGMINLEEGASDAILDQIELTYWEDAGSIDEQPYLQPVYLFKGKYKLYGKDATFSGIVPAVDNGFTLHKEVGQDSAANAVK